MTLASLLFFIGGGVLVGFAFGLAAALAVTPEAAPDDDQHECVKGEQL